MFGSGAGTARIREEVCCLFGQQAKINDKVDV
jgi:hypothetical protein